MCKDCSKNKVQGLQNVYHLQNPKYVDNIIYSHNTNSLFPDLSKQPMSFSMKWGHSIATFKHDHCRDEVAWFIFYKWRHWRRKNQNKNNIIHCHYAVNQTPSDIISGEIFTIFCPIHNLARNPENWPTVVKEVFIPWYEKERSYISLDGKSPKQNRMKKNNISFCLWSSKINFSNIQIWLKITIGQSVSTLTGSNLVKVDARPPAASLEWKEFRSGWKR